MKEIERWQFTLPSRTRSLRLVIVSRHWRSIPFSLESTIKSRHKYHVNHQATQLNYLKYSFHPTWIVFAARSCRFQMRVDETISNSLRVGNCFLNLTSIWSCNCLNVSLSSTWPRTYFTSACKMSKQWILFPFDIGRLKETSAKVLGFGTEIRGTKINKNSHGQWI